MIRGLAVRGFPAVLAIAWGCASVPQQAPVRARGAEERDARLAAALGNAQPFRISLLSEGKLCGEVDPGPVLAHAAERSAGSWLDMGSDATEPLRLKVVAPAMYGAYVQGVVAVQLLDPENVVLAEREVTVPKYPASTRDPYAPSPGAAEKEAEEKAAVSACLESVVPGVEQTVAMVLARDLPRMVERAARAEPVPGVGTWVPAGAADRVLLEAAQAGPLRIENTVVRGFGCGHPARVLGDELADAGDWDDEQAAPGTLRPLVVFRQDESVVVITFHLVTHDGRIAWRRVTSVPVDRWFDNSKGVRAAQARCVKQAERAIAEIVASVQNDVLPAVRTRLQAGTAAAPDAAGTVFRVAVLEFHSDASLDPTVLARLSDAARAGAADALSTGAFTVITRESSDAVLRDLQRGPASEGDDDVSTARSLGAHFLLSGDAARVDGTWVVTLKLIDVQTGALLQGEDARSATRLGLADAVRAVAQRLCGRLSRSG